MPIQTTRTRSLEIAYERSGPRDGRPLVLVHGWPDSLRCWDGILPALHAAGIETIVPNIRGYGPTVFHDPTAPRSGETAALARDVLDLADALDLDRFGLVGHDWGTRTLFDACILAPDRIDNAVALSLGWWPASAARAVSWAQKQAFWYQWYLATPHGAEAFKADPHSFCRHLWETWSPAGWYSQNDWREAATAFQNPDWCEIVIHYYRARWGQAETDPFYDADTARIRSATHITVPTMIVIGLADSCCLPELSENCEPYFTGAYSRETLPGIGHFPQREAPDVVASLIIGWSRTHDRDANTTPARSIDIEP